MNKSSLIVGLICASGVACAEPTPQELTKEIIRRPWPGNHSPEPPALPETVVSNTLKEIESTPAIRRAFAKLDAAKQGNATWSPDLAGLEKEKAVWSLLCCLCHPNEDVQIGGLRALARLKDERSLPFLLQYASAMAVPEEGSEEATVHGIIHQETGKALSAVTGLTIELRKDQDPEGLKAAIAKCKVWLMERQKKESREQAGGDADPPQLNKGAPDAGAAAEPKVLTEAEARKLATDFANEQLKGRTFEDAAGKKHPAPEIKPAHWRVVEKKDGRWRLAIDPPDGFIFVVTMNLDGSKPVLEQACLALL
jgi:hypothetical protein